MKKTLYFLALLLVVIVLIDRLTGFCLDRLYPRVLTGQTGGKINHLLAHDSPFQLLVMGNSRALYQIIPDSFHVPAYNISHAGMGPAFQAGLLSVLEQQHKLPRTVLLHVEPSDFTVEQKNDDIQNLKYYYGKNDLVTQYLNDASPMANIKFLFSSYRYNGRIFSLLRNYLRPLDGPANGYEAIAPTPRDSMNTLYSYQRNLQFAEPGFNPAQLKFLDDFLNTCRRNGITVIAFTSPAFRLQSRHPSTIKELAGYFRGQNIPYIDAQQLSPDSLVNSTHYWKDANHLNHRGAELESFMLAQILRNRSN